MIQILHGDNISASREKLNELLKGKDSIIRFDGKKATPAEIEEAVEGKELFSSEKTVVIEQLTKLGTSAKTVIEYLVLREKDSEIIIWEDHKAAKTFLSKFPKASILEFSLPKRFFEFLDNFEPGKRVQEEVMLGDISQQFSEEQVFYALIKRVRQLLMLKTNDNANFSEISSLQDWQKRRLYIQARKWNEEQLIFWYQKLFALEVALKSSNLPMSLGKHLDILLTRAL